MRREDDAAGVAGPMLHVERGIIFRQERITAIAENAFHKIQVAHQIARHEETDLHRLLRRETGNFRADQRPQEQRDKTFRRLRLRRGEWQRHQFARRIEREREHFGEGDFRHAELVVGNRQTALGDMENALRRAPVAARIVQHALLDAVGTDDVRMKFVAVERQRQDAGEAGPVEDERARRQFGDRHILEIVVKKSLDALVHRAQIMAEQPVLFARLAGHRGNDFREFRVTRDRHGRAADQGELDVDVRNELCRQFVVHFKTFHRG